MSSSTRPERSLTLFWPRRSLRCLSTKGSSMICAAEKCGGSAAADSWNTSCIRGADGALGLRQRQEFASIEPNFARVGLVQHRYAHRQCGFPTPTFRPARASFPRGRSGRLRPAPWNEAASPTIGLASMSWSILRSAVKIPTWERSATAQPPNLKQCTVCEADC